LAFHDLVTWVLHMVELVTVWVCVVLNVSLNKISNSSFNHRTCAGTTHLELEMYSSANQHVPQPAGHADSHRLNRMSWYIMQKIMQAPPSHSPPFRVSLFTLAIASHSFVFLCPDEVHPTHFTAYSRPRRSRTRHSCHTQLPPQSSWEAA
jgi:hypothetical protein